MKSLRRFGGLALLFLLSACIDGGGGSSSSSGGGSGSVGVSLTDAPSEEFSKVEMEIYKVELLPSAEDGERVTIYDNPTGQPAIDLLSLRNHAVMLSMDDDVPAGRYSKLRVYVGAIQLYDLAGDPITEPVKLPSNKIDVNPRGPFQLGDGDALYVQLDLDANKSFQVKQAGKSGKYIFRPVVFADVLSAAEPGKLIRASGYIRDLNTLDGSTWFALCPAEDHKRKKGDDDCMNVVAEPGDTPVFDATADPVGLTSLQEGQWAAALGHPRHGEFMSMDALVVETGQPGDDMPESYTEVKGTVADQPPPANGGFAVEGDNASQAVQLQPGAPVISRDGELLDETAIAPDLEVMTEGVVDLNGTLKATLAIIDEDSVNAVKLNGTFVNLGTDSFAMLVDGVTYIVWFDDDTKVLEVGEVDGKLTSNRIEIDDIKPGQEIEVHGVSRVDTSVDADSVLVFD